MRRLTGLLCVLAFCLSLGGCATGGDKGGGEEETATGRTVSVRESTEPAGYRTVVGLRGTDEMSPPQVVGPAHRNRQEVAEEIETISRAVAKGETVLLPWLAVPAENVDLATMYVMTRDDAEAARGSVFRTVIDFRVESDGQTAQLEGPPAEDAESLAPEMRTAHRALVGGRRITLPWLSAEADRLEFAYVYAAAPAP